MIFNTCHSEDAPHYTWDNTSASSGSTNDSSLSRGSSTVAPDKEKGYKSGDGSDQLVKGESWFNLSMPYPPCSLAIRSRSSIVKPRKSIPRIEFVSIQGARLHRFIHPSVGSDYLLDQWVSIQSACNSPEGRCD